MKNFELQDVIRVIKSAGSSIDTPRWIWMIKMLRQLPLYIEQEGNEKTVVTDQDGYRFYHLYLNKLDGNIKSYDFIELEKEAQALEISILISVSKEEPESILLEEPSGHIYFANVEYESENLRILI